MTKYFTLSPNSDPASTQVEQLDVAALDDITRAYAGFVVFYQNDDQCMQELKVIRQHDNPNVYLQPVVLAHQSFAKSANISAHLRKRFDYEINQPWQSDVHLSECINQFVHVNQWIHSLANNDGSLSDSALRFKTLRLMASRESYFTPEPTIHTQYGYEYTLLAPLFKDYDGSVEQVLAFLHSQELIKERFVRKSHFCPYCDSAFLNFKETCPDCHSDNLGHDELVHHFKCGHTDAIQHFRKSGALQCPKCDDMLRHIGVDYDKPSTVARCLNCQLSFQNPPVKADCFACHRTTDTDDLILRSVQAFKISAIGANAARYGLDALFTSILQSDLNLYSNDEMASFIKVEKARIARYKKSQSSLAIIHFTNLEAMFTNLGRKTEQVFKEMSAIFKSVFRSSDVITAKNESLFVILMTETSVNKAKLALKRLDDSTNALFKDNLNFNLTMASTIFDITEVHSANKVIDDFIGQYQSNKSKAIESSKAPES